ncbi:hypothetical protein AB3X96_42040 [Paraburkholderia sp. BR13439]
MSTVISNAAYGVWNNTIDVTDQVRQQYANGTRVFVAGNQYGDPSPGDRK